MEAADDVGPAAPAFIFLLPSSEPTEHVKPVLPPPPKDYPIPTERLGATETLKFSITVSSSNSTLSTLDLQRQNIGLSSASDKPRLALLCRLCLACTVSQGSSTWAEPSSLPVHTPGERLLHSSSASLQLSWIPRQLSHQQIWHNDTHVSEKSTMSSSTSFSTGTALIRFAP